jgi:membrane peptidoglycan carboxypeptidase
MATKRRVRKPQPAKPIRAKATGFKGSAQRFFLSFTPSRFKQYWISRAGAIRLAKLIGVFFIFLFLVFLWYAKDLPSPSKINARVSAQTTKFYDRTGKILLYELYGDTNRSIIDFNNMPDNVKHATIAIEDKSFYKHGAFSIFGIARAMQGVIFHDVSKGGGSTITQQYVKNALLTDERSYSRKIKELILSIEIEQFYSKNDILKLYLNEIPYGNRAYGIESACKTYFPQRIDKTSTDQLCAKNLTLSESALLAAIPNAPTYYSPYGTHVTELLDRQHQILDLMAQQKYITQDQATAAKWTADDLKADLNPQQTQYANIKAPHFVLYTQEYLENKYGSAQVTEGGLKIITTLDYDKQLAAEKAVADNMKHIRSEGGSNSALVSTDPNSGQIYAMVGSYDFYDKSFGNFNVANAGRQPGSSFKPFVYATLYGKNANAVCAKDRSCSTYGPGTTLYDVPTDFGGYKPANFGNKNYGIITTRQALAGSLNIPAVKTLAMAGIADSITTAKSLGITTLNNTPDSYGYSLVLGSGEVKLSEMANAYESFANGGQHYAQTPVLTVTDPKGNVLEDNTKPQKPKQALDPQVAYLIANVLSDQSAKTFVFGNDLELQNACSNNAGTNCVHYGVKTGTTEHFNDAWTVGFTQNVTAGVWVGNNDNAPMSGAAADIAAPVWREYMNLILKGQANDAWKAPTGIKTVTLDKDTGRLPAAASKNLSTDVFASWYVPMSSANGTKATVDKVSGLLATECTPTLAQDVAYSSAILPEITYAENSTQYNLWLKALQAAGYSSSGGTLPTTSDNVHSCDDVKPIVTISGATGGGPYNFDVKVTLGAFGTTKPGIGSAQLQVLFDDQIISTQAIANSGTYPISYTPTTKGSHTFKAVVTDTGFYQGSDEQVVTVTNTGNVSFKGITPATGDSPNAGAVSFSWTADTGASSYDLYVDNNKPLPTINLKATAIVLNKNVSHTWYVKSDQGNSTPINTFTVQ